MKAKSENRSSSQASKTIKDKVYSQEVVLPYQDKIGAIVSEKNCFVEVQKRSFYSGINESQDIYKGRRQLQKGQTNPLFIPTDKKDEMIAHEAEMLRPCQNEELEKGIGRVDLTDEALDDWIAQSMNRTLPEILDPKKKFNIPYKYLDDLKRRYPHLIPQAQVTDDDEEETFLRGLLDDDSIVDRKTLEERKRLFNIRKRQNNQESFSLHQTKAKHFDVKIDAKKLEPKILKGTLIPPPTIRQNISQQGSDTNPSHLAVRNSMSPLSTTTYNPRISSGQPNRKRFYSSGQGLQEDYDSLESKQQQKTNHLEDSLNDKAAPISSNTTNNNSYKLFSLNMSNFLRQNNTERDIETSLAERELNYIQVVMNKQNERKQREEQTKEQKKQTVEHFRDIQKLNRKELSRLTSEAIAYCQNPPDLPSYYQAQIPTAPQPTREKRPKTNQSQRNQTASTTQSKRFFILTKLQSKPGTAESGRRGGSLRQTDREQKMNQTGMLNTTFFNKSRNDGRPSTSTSFNFGQTAILNETNGFKGYPMNAFTTTHVSGKDIITAKPRERMKVDLKNSRQDFLGDEQVLNEIQNSQNLFYSSLRSYKQSRMNIMQQKYTLKQSMDDYVNIDANRSTSIVKYNPTQQISKKRNLSFQEPAAAAADQSGGLKIEERNHDSGISDLNSSDGSFVGGSGSYKSSQDLPEKVERLLNSGSEDCLIKPNDDFANLVLHLEELKASEKKPESQMNNSEFWLHKSWKLIDEGQNEVATQCLKQVLIVDKLHFKSVFNMGSLYEKTKKFKTALEWLRISQEFEPTHEQTLYGIALCLYKIRKFEESYEQINSLIDLIKDKDEPPSKYIYLRALCLKQSGRIDEAEDDYKIFYKKTSPKNFDLLMHFMILFSFKYRNKIAKYQDLEIKYSGRTFCNFHSAIQQIIQGEYFEIQLADYYSEQLRTWIDFDALILKISQLSFFKRFAHQLLRKAIPHMSHNLIEKEKLINAIETEVFIIIAGNVQVFDHTKDYEKPDIVSYYSEGDIIGCDHLEHNLSRKPNVWLITQTPVEYLKMDKSMFFDLWKGQYSLEGEKITSLLKNCPMLKGISEITLLKLSYELVQMKEFQRDELIYNDGTYLESMNYNYIEMRKAGKKRGAGIVKRIVEKMITVTAASTFSRVTKFRKLYLKHRSKIRGMMWSTMLIKGIYIIVDGIVEIENDKNWSYHLTPGDFFGENLMFKVKSLANFGRMRTASSTAKLLFLPREYFNQINSLDMALMKSNCKKREQIDNIEYLAKRYNQVRELKLQRKRDEEDKKEQLFNDEEYIAQSF